VHDITWDDVYVALDFVQGVDPDKAKDWINLIGTLTNRGDWTSWKDDLSLVKESCLVKRTRCVIISLLFAVIDVF
jgi:hypothetical protein